MQSYKLHRQHLKKAGMGLFVAFVLFGFSAVIQAQDDAPAESLPPEEEAKQQFNLALELSQDPTKETEMLSAYNACIMLDPTYVDAYVNLGVFHFGKKEYAEAEKQLKKAVELSPSDTSVLDNLGKTYVVLRKTEDAVKAFKAAIAADAAYAGGHKELGKLHYKQKKYALAAEELGKYNQLSAGDHYAHYLAGKSYDKLKKSTKALNEFNAAIKAKKNYSQAHRAKAGIYLKQEKFSKAIAAYRTGIKYSAKDYRALYNLAIALQSSDPDNLDQAIAAWKRFLKIGKNIPKAKDMAATAKQQIKDLQKQKTNRAMTE